MNIRIRFLLAACLLCVAPQALASEAASAWVRERAIALQRIEPGGSRADLGFLRELVGNARVVGFGEAVHGGHEFLAFRNRLFEYLVEELGFTAIAMETDFVDGTAIDDYVTGGGGLTPALVAGVFSFGAPDAPQENRQLLEWMRAYNSRADVRRKLRFYGLDMMGRSLGHGQPIPDRPLDTALRYVAGVDPELSRRFDRRVRPMLRRLASGKEDAYAGMAPAQRDALTLAIADLAALFERRQVQWIADTSVPAYERAYRSVLNARALDADLRANGWWACDRQQGPCDTDQRDAAAAGNLQWALEKEGAQGRILLFEHNAHVRKGPARDGQGNLEFTSLGEHARARLGADLVVIGSSFGRLQGFHDLEDDWYNGLAPVLAEPGTCGAGGEPARSPVRRAGRVMVEPDDPPRLARPCPEPGGMLRCTGVFPEHHAVAGPGALKRAGGAFPWSLSATITVGRNACYRSRSTPVFDVLNIY